MEKIPYGQRLKARVGDHLETLKIFDSIPEDQMRAYEIYADRMKRFCGKISAVFHMRPGTKDTLLDHYEGGIGLYNKIFKQGGLWKDQYVHLKNCFREQIFRVTNEGERAISEGEFRANNYKLWGFHDADEMGDSSDLTSAEKHGFTPEQQKDFSKKAQEKVVGLLQKIENPKTRDSLIQLFKRFANREKHMDFKSYFLKFIDGLQPLFSPNVRENYFQYNLKENPYITEEDMRDYIVNFVFRKKVLGPLCKISPMLIKDVKHQVEETVRTVLHAMMDDDLISDAQYDSLEEELFFIIDEGEDDDDLEERYESFKNIQPPLITMGTEDVLEKVREV